jgi:hypothetical protein
MLYMFLIKYLGDLGENIEVLVKYLHEAKFHFATDVVLEYF